MRASLFVDHRRVNAFISVLNFCGWSQPQTYFNSEMIYSMYVYTLLEFFNDLFTVNKRPSIIVAELPGWADIHHVYQNYVLSAHLLFQLALTCLPMGG